MAITKISAAMTDLDGAVTINESSADVDFRVESDGDANMFFIDGGNNRVLIGTAASRAMAGVTPNFFIEGESSYDTNSIGIVCNANHAGQAPNFHFGKSRGTSEGSNTVVQSGDTLGSMYWHGADGTNLEQAAAITVEVDGTPGANEVPGRIRFHTTADGAQYATERIRIDSNGRVGIGTTGPRGVLDVVGDHAVGYILTVQNDGNNVNRYGIKVVAGSDDSSGTSYLLDFFDGDATNVGAITQSGGTVSYSPFTANHPCVIPDEDNDKNSTKPAYPYGTLLEITSLSYLKKSDGSDTERGIIYNVQKSSKAYSRKILGAYGGSMNQGPAKETNKHQVLILGDGHILCNNEKGNISVGDGICTSTTAGIGMKADKMAMIIGIAQEDVTFSGSETKLVAVQYGLQQFTPWTD